MCICTWSPRTRRASWPSDSGVHVARQCSTIFQVDFPESEAPKTSPVRPLVLVVEDDPLTARLLEAALMKEGFEVHRAASAAEAKALLDQNTYHAMTLDLLLPDQQIHQLPDQQILQLLYLRLGCCSD